MKFRTVLVVALLLVAGLILSADLETVVWSPLLLW